MMDIIFPPASAAFDYDTLPPEVAAEAKSIVADARALHKQTLEKAAKIGRRLLDIKPHLKHGQFLKWIKAEFAAFGKSTAYNCMNVAKNLGDVSELPTVGSLPQVTVYRLAAPSFPSDVREKIVTRLKTGEPIKPDEIVDEVTTTMAEVANEVAVEEMFKKAAKAEADAEKIAAILNEEFRDKDKLQDFVEVLTRYVYDKSFLAVVRDKLLIPYAGAA